MVFLDQEFGSYDDAELRDDFKLYRRQCVGDDDLASFRPGSGSGSGCRRLRRPEKTPLFEGTYECGEEERVVGDKLAVRREFAKGSNDTDFYEGTYGGRKVAVKCIAKAHNEVAENEMKLLNDSDDHPNVIRYHGSEQDHEFIYILLGRCDCNLYDLVRNNLYPELWGPKGYPSAVFLKLMKGIAAGLAHLHSLSIAHGNLKPHNVLIAKGKELCAKLSDLSNSRRLVGDMASLESSATVSGSLGRQVPEQIHQGPQQIGHEHQTLASDLKRLGFVIFFCMTRGKQNEVKLSSLQHIPEAVDLLTRLLDPIPELRPKASEVLQHPLFWNSEKRLSFFRDTSDQLEDQNVGSIVVTELESEGRAAFSGIWNVKMEPEFLSCIRQHRWYKYNKVRDLLRVIRNTMNHYRKFPKEIQDLLGYVPEELDDYFCSKFPKLLMKVYKVMHRHCKQEDWFRKYLKN